MIKPCGQGIEGPGIYGLDPLGYLEFLCLMSSSALMLTDSGGIQEETTVLGVPCVTLREETERPVTLTDGTNVLAGVQKKKIIDAAYGALNKYASGKGNGMKIPPLWDGRAAVRIVDVLEKAGGDVLAVRHANTKDFLIRKEGLNP